MAIKKISWILEAFQRQKQNITIFLLGSAALHILGLALPLISMAIIDKAIISGSQSSLIVLVMLMFVVGMASNVFGNLNQNLFRITGLEITKDLAMHVNRQLLTLPLNHFARGGIGDNLARINEIDKIKNFIDNWVLQRGVELLFACFYIAFMLYLSPNLTLLAMAIIPLHGIIYWSFGKKTRNGIQQQFESGKKYQSTLIESLSAIETIKSHRAENRIISRLKALFFGYISTIHNLNSLNQWTGFLIGTASLLVEAGTWYIGATLVIEAKLTLGMLFAFQMLAGRAIAPLQSSTGIFQEVQEIRNSIVRLGEIMEKDNEGSPSNIGQEEDSHDYRCLESISIENVSVSLGDEGKPIFNGISMTLKKGVWYSIIGPSGAGKSTFAKLLCGMIQPSQGEVSHKTSNNHVVSDLRSIRKDVLYIPQDCALFSGTLYENITMFGNDLPEGVFAAASGAQLLELVEDPATLLTLKIEEGGANLSGGQRQRVALARALLYKPAFLILDEATSALDSETERNILRALKERHSDIAVLLITHKLNVAMQMDYVIQFHQDTATCTLSLAPEQNRTPQSCS